MKLRTWLLAVVAVLATSALVVQGQVPGVNSTLNSIFTLAYETQTSKPTYSATGIFTTAATPTDVCTITGSATKTIRVRRVIIGGTTSAIETIPISVVKRSTATSGGNGTLVTKVPYDSTSTAASAVVETWTTNGTLGTTVGKLTDLYVSFSNLTTGAVPMTEIKFGRDSSPVFLRGAAQELAVSLDGQAFNGASFSCTIEWTEDTDF